MKPKKAQTVEEVAPILVQAGTHVVFRNGSPNLAVVDNLVVWCDDIAPFAYLQPEEQIRRFTSLEVAQNSALLY